MTLSTQLTGNGLGTHGRSLRTHACAFAAAGAAAAGRRHGDRGESGARPRGDTAVAAQLCTQRRVGGFRSVQWEDAELSSRRRPARGPGITSGLVLKWTEPLIDSFGFDPRWMEMTESFSDERMSVTMA